MEMRDWNDVATSQELLATKRSWQKQATDYFLEHPEETGLCQSLTLKFMIPRFVGKLISVVLSKQICSNSLQSQ
jgi:hypothetical protein